MAYVKIDGFLCERCGHRWILKQPDRPEPKVCPSARATCGTRRGNGNPRATPTATTPC